MNWLVESALKMARMSDAEINDLSAKLPAFGRLAAALKKSEPTLAQAAPLVDQLYTELKAEWPDIVAVTPTVEELIEFVSSKGTS
jgi:hypothetical protein